jgi:hypothetical protein
MTEPSSANSHNISSTARNDIGERTNKIPSTLYHAQREVSLDRTAQKRFKA